MTNKESKHTAKSEQIKNIAYAKVLEIRGSSDAPAFDYCVDAEYLTLLEEAVNNHQRLQEENNVYASKLEAMELQNSMMREALMGIGRASTLREVNRVWDEWADSLILGGGDNE